jgi:uncharacterized protein (TIGR02118 family)
MIKTIAVAFRRKDMTHEEFLKYWRNEHASLVKKTWPGLKKYVQNEIVVDPGQERTADGVVEMYYDDVASYKKAMAWVMSDAGKAIRDDGDKFCEIRPGGAFFVVEEHIAKDDTKKK